MKLLDVPIPSSGIKQLSDNIDNYDIIICNMKVLNYYEGCYVDTVENFKNKRVVFISGTEDGMKFLYVDNNHIEINIHKYGLCIIGIKL